MLVLQDKCKYNVGCVDQYSTFYAICDGILILLVFFLNTSKNICNGGNRDSVTPKCHKGDSRETSWLIQRMSLAIQRGNSACALSTL
jgi:hypothetical protein